MPAALSWNTFLVSIEVGIGLGLGFAIISGVIALLKIGRTSPPSV